MSKQYKVVKSTTKTFSVTLKQDGSAVTDLTNWGCFIQLRSIKTREIAGSVDREVTTKSQDNTKFVITLTNTETNIEEGSYRLGIEFRNTQTGQVVEDPDNTYEIEIVEEWVYD